MELLQDFDEYTTACSSKAYASITISIEIYNDLLQTLEDFVASSSNRKDFPDLIHGANAAYIKLSDYYTRTDNSPIYSVAIALHPTYRYDYWEREEWGEFLEPSKTAVREVWNSGYRPRVLDPSTPEPTSFNKSLSRLARSKASIDNYNDELEVFATADPVIQAPLE
ncbi:hypothetical protein BGZ76_004501, partial [Entomortierella beljakovae]